MISNLSPRFVFWLALTSLIACLSFSGVASATSKPLFVEAVDYTSIEKIADCEETLYQNKPRLYSRCANPDKLFDAAKTFARENDMPLVILWGFDACPACEDQAFRLFSPKMFPTNKAIVSSLNSQQKIQFSEKTKGKNQLALVRINSGSSISQNQVFADKIGANKVASELGWKKVWSPMFMVVNHETGALSTNSHISGYNFCSLGEELASGLEQAGIVKKDPNWDRSCYIPDYSDEELISWENDCEAGNKKKCFWAGTAHKRAYYDANDEQDSQLAETFLETAKIHLAKACDNGLVTACPSAGFLLPRDGEKYSKDSINLFRRGCNQRDMSACGRLASGYAYGEGGLRKNPKKAVALYSMACDSHDPWACSQLGEMAFYRDPGTRAYQSSARELLAFGCRNGISWACDSKYK